LIPGTDNLKPIYAQLAEWLELEILKGSIREEERIYSQYQLSDMFNINPATAAKGLSMLLEKGLLYKKRGLGMFVSPGATETIRRDRAEHNIKEKAMELAIEAERLNLEEERLLEIIREARLQARKENNRK